MFKVVHHVRRVGVISEVFRAKFVCHLIGVILLFKMIPYFRRLSRHGWLLIVNCLTAMSEGPSVLKKKHSQWVSVMTSCIWPFKLKALQPFIHRPAASHIDFDLILTRHGSKCFLVFWFFFLQPIDQWNFGRLMSFWSTSAWSTIWGQP